VPRSLRLILIGIAGVAGTALLLVAAAYLTMTSEPGQRWLAAELARELSGPNGTVEIRDLEGAPPFHLTAGEIRISDRAGEWLVIHDARIEIDGRALLHRELAITLLRAREIEIARLPAANRAPLSPEPTHFVLPKLPLDLSLMRIEVDRLDVAAAVMGEPARMRLAGDARLDKSSAGAHLAIDRTDGEPGSAKLALALAGTPPSLDLSLEINEPSGAVADRWLQRSDRPPLGVVLRGSGPTSDWRGTLIATLGSEPVLDTRLRLSADPTLSAAIEGEARPSGLIPARFLPIAGERLSFSAAGELAGDEVLQVASLKVTTPAAELEASGHLDRRAQTVDVTAHLSVLDLARAEPLAGAPLAGDFRLDARLGGSLRRPSLDLEIAGSEARYAEAAASGIEASLRLAAADDALDRWRISSQGRVTGVTENARDLPARLGQAIGWSFEGELDRAEQALALDRLSVSGAGLALDAAGRLSRQASTGTVTLRVADLAAFGGLAGLPEAGGSLALDARLAADAEANTTASLQASADGLHTGMPAIDAVLGPNPTLSAEATRSRGGALDIRSASLTAGEAKAEASGSLSAGGDRLQGKMTASLPRLAPLGPALGFPLQGEVQLTAELAGSLDRPSLSARIDGRELGGARPILRSLSAELSVEDLRSPAGTLDADFATAELKGRLETRLSRPAADQLSLSKLSLTAGAARLDGALDYSLSTRRAAGKLTGKVPDLRPWSRIAGVTLAGRADLALSLSARDGQAADLTLNAADLAVGQGASAVHVARLSLTGKGTELEAKPRGTIGIDIANLAAGELRLAKTSLKAAAKSSTAATFSFESTGQLVETARGGPRNQPLTASLAGDWSRSGAAHHLVLSQLEAKLGSDAATLRQPLRLTYGPREERLENLALDIAGGQIRGSASLVGEQLAVKLDANRVALAPFTRLAAKPISGTVDLDAELGGTAGAPTGRIALKGRGFQFTAAGAGKLPPLAIDGELKPSRDQFGLELAIATSEAKLLTVSGTVPFRLSARPLALAVPNDRPMALKISGDGRLEALAQVLPLGEDRMSGGYQLVFDIGGSLRSPAASGRLSIDNGRYSSRVFGTEITGIAAELTGDRTRLSLTRFEAGDGAGGTLALSGAADLAAAPEARLDFQARLSRFRIADSDQARATADGEIRLEGALSAPRLYARLTVPKGDFRIPDRLPIKIVKMDVVEIDSRQGPEARTKQTAGETAPNAKPVLRVSLDAELTIPGQAFVRGRGLDSEWRGKLTFTGTSDQPAISGGLEVVHGSLSLLGKSFAIQRGSITFPTGLADPQIDVLAEAVAADITAQVSLTGSASSPKVQLTSQPQVPQDEILSRLLFGKDAKQITPAEGLQLAYAAASLADGGPDVLDKLRQATGLDRLTLGSDADANALGPPVVNRTGNTTTTTATPTVSGGKYIAPGVFLGVEEGADPSTGTATPTTRSRIEVEITPHISAESRVGISGSSEIGIGWKRDY
jgi:translocation and assembly module TamB